MTELTAGERLIYAGQRLDPDAPLYNMALAFELSGALDIDAFDAAFRDIVAGTDALRTTVLDAGGEPERRVCESIEAGVEHLAMPESEVGDGDLRALLEQRARRVFSFDAPLFDSCLIRRRDDRYVWFLNQHHLVTDAWSVGVLQKRLGNRYRSLVERESAVPVPPVPAYPQYAEFAEHQRALRGTERLARAVDHWNHRPGESAPLRLYGSEERGSGRTHRIRVPLGATRTAQLRALAARPPFRGLTSEQSHFAVIATVLAAWLHRISDARVLRIGCPWHNRATAAFRDTAGLFIELYPLCTTIGEEETFATLGAQILRESTATLRFVVPGASAAPGARRFGVVLNYITANLGSFGGIPSRADWIHTGFGDREHRVRLQVHDFDAEGEPTLDFDLDEATFGPTERDWAVRHFMTLFDAAAHDANTAIADVAVSTWDETAALSAGPRVHRSTATVTKLFGDRVREAPDAEAVIDGDRAMSYGELAAHAHAIALLLHERGVEPGEVVGVMLERSPELIAAMLGALASGCAFVPLEPAHPDHRLAWQVADAGVRIILTSATLASRAAAMAAGVTIVETSHAPASPGDPLQDRSDAAALAYVLYTSGSTGRPKGVEVAHSALADYVAWAAERYADGARLRFPLFTSPAFDLTLTSIFVPLVTGGTVVVYRNEPGGGGLLVRRVLEDDRVDVVKLTPSHLTLVRDMDLSRSRVRRLIVGGEDFKRATADAIHRAFGGRVEVLNEYGPTEATIACMLHRFDAEHDREDSVPIGRPADNARILVLDAAGRPLPRGAAGEICIGGPRVARGYRGDPERTAAAFMPDPAVAGGRVYRSGDVGRWGRDGVLRFLGRRDEQVKVRGARIELGEIESAIVRHPDVLAAVAHVVRPRAEEAQVRCARCGLQGTHPEAQIDVAGICAVCRRFEGQEARVARYFGQLDDLRRILGEARDASAGPHDCLMMFSGGKDSTYALCRIVELGARPLVFTLDNGFISDEAKTNIRRVVDMLGLELVSGETAAMPAIFADSLARFSNVCNGCFKTIYTLAMQLAVSRGITHIVTGLSRGQIFETRLADLYRRGIDDPDEVDRTILDARKAYHRMDDAVARELDTSLVASDEVLDRLQFVDFYRYCDDSLDEILDYVARRTPWIRPSDTGRSTNCLINQAGIFVHLTERGFHNYAMPYSWDVRLGHKRRDAAVAELEDELDDAEIRAMLDRVGYRERPAPPPEARLAAYYTSHRDIPVPELRQFLEHDLPAEIVPSTFVRLDSLPVGPGGKIDRTALPRPDAQRPAMRTAAVSPRSPVESALADVWAEVLGVHPIGVHDDFFELGGDSMQCIQIVAAARARGLVFAPRDVFAHPTIAELALRANGSGASPAPAASATAEELSELLADYGD